MLDQFLHFILGLVATSFTVWIFPWWGALAATMLVAVVREMVHHPWQCHGGCQLDLLFWLLGSLTMIVLYNS